MEQRPQQRPWKIAVAVTTIGRAEPLRALLRSLSTQSEPPIWVGVADQSSGAAVREAVAEFSGQLNVEVVATARGASRGRNVLWRRAPESATHIVFPNDTTVYHEEFIRRVAAEIADGDDVVAVHYVDDKGIRRAFSSGSVPLDRKSAWFPIEPACVLPLRLVSRVGGFNEDLGTGTASPWQSSGLGDLLLRIMDACANVNLRLVATVRVDGRSEFAGLTRQERHWKARAYGRGFGAALRINDYSWSAKARAVIGAFTLGLRQRQRFGLLDSLFAGLGRLEGVTGVTWGTPTRPAVDR